MIKFNFKKILTLFIAGIIIYSCSNDIDSDSFANQNQIEKKLLLKMVKATQKEILE